MVLKWPHAAFRTLFLPFRLYLKYYFRLLLKATRIIYVLKKTKPDMRFLILCSCLLFFSFGISTEAWSQKDKNDTEEPQKPTRFRTTLDLSVEQRAQMKTCPVHGKHMSLNRDYKANADTVRQLADYPFAKQFNFRRYCNKCTRVLHKEVKRFEREVRRDNKSSSGSFERCVVHNEQMKPNPDFSAVNSVRDEDTSKKYPNAQQYRHRLYCTLCTKAMKKDEEVTDVEKPDTNEK